MVAALMTVAWWFGQFPYTVRRTPHPELGPAYEFRIFHAFTTSRWRPASTLTSALGHIYLNKLFLRKAITQGFYIYLYYSFWTALFYACRWSTSPALRSRFGKLTPLSQIGINRLAWSPCLSCCHTDVFGCRGDFGIAERDLPHRVFGAQALFLLLLTLHKLFNMQQFYSSLLPLSPVCTIFCA